MKKKKDISGLIFSAILVTAFVVCSYFFTGIIKGATGLDDTVKKLLTELVFVVFGLILFYATRVGDGKQVKRFSLAALILLDLPAIYIILASAAPGIPFPFDIDSCTEMVQLAAVALGYGVPYTFLSGYELEAYDDDKNKTEGEVNSKSNTDDADEQDNEDDNEFAFDEMPAVEEMAEDVKSDEIEEIKEVSDTADTADSDGE